MKILAIRGANLASLEGEFALELDEGPLARAGVFAICGPTGAGKSTLLDAMCLALFDTAPRVASTSRVRVGRESEDDAERLTTSDPRTILRKGAGHGFAEVDFRGVGGGRYRARWEVRRARGRASGRIQQTSMSLVDLDDGSTLSGARKTDVKAAIEERLGLTFDQFRRSVLLAQGDFAAFLDADAKERAGLLERMTGTEIYGAISVAAHERAVRERQRLEELRMRTELVILLGAEERAQLEEGLVALDLRAREDEKRARDAEQAVRWYGQLDALRNEEEAARGEHERIARQLELAESQRHELEAYEKALPVRAFLEAADRAASVVSERTRELAQAEADRSVAEASATEAERARVEASAAVDGAERALAEAGPVLGQARVLDRELGAQRDAVRSLEARCEQRELARRTAHERRRSLERDLDRERERAERARAWLAEHPAAERAAARWDRHEERLAQVIALSAEARTHERALREAALALDQACAVVTARAEAASGARAAASEAEARWREAADAARSAPSEALAEVRSSWARRRSGLEALIGVVELAQRAYDAQRRHRDLGDRAFSARERSLAEARRAGEERERTRAQLEEAQHARDRLRSTLDLSAHRAELREGEACPLCGSLDHPFAREQPIVESLLGEQDARVRQLGAALSQLDARLADARRAAEAQEEAQREAEREAAQWASELREARERYAETARALGSEDARWPVELPSAPAAPVDWGPLFAAAGEADGPLLDPRARVALIEARDAAAHAIEELEAEERARRERERGAEALRESFERAREAAEAAARAHGTAIEARDAAQRELDGLRKEAAAREAARDASIRELRDVLSSWPRWQERLDADADAFAREVGGEVAAWLDRAAARDAAEEQARSIAPMLAAASEHESAASAAYEEARAELAQASAVLTEKGAERAALIGGADPDAHERALGGSVREARSKAHAASDAAAAATRVAADRRARQERLRDALAEARTELERGRQRLDAALAEAGLDEHDARARLAHDPARVESWRRELKRLDADRARQAAVLAERTRKREAHETQDPPRLGAAEANEAMTQAARKSHESREALVAARHRLERDDEHRAQAAALAAEVDAQRERLAVWDALADLIGSASGAKLRVFAQSLTLELLLEHANMHLAELAPRYSLARVPGEDLALMVIDHEMGDEVRAVGSLSGGESFLVALGMALGLASLSSQRARIDSLFIDEGFGALDPASLDLVLSTLDRLQASGRQVGVISHVPTMAERFDTRVSVVAAGPARSRVELVEGFA